MTRPGPLWLLLAAPLWCTPTLAPSAAHTGEDEAERSVFSTLDHDTDAARRVAAAGAVLSSVLSYDAVEAILRQADLLEQEDRWLKPIKPMLLQGWWDGDGGPRRRAERGLLSTGANASDGLTQLVRLFMLRRTASVDVVRQAVGGDDTLATLLELGVLYYPATAVSAAADSSTAAGQGTAALAAGENSSQLLASAVQLFPLR